VSLKVKAKMKTSTNVENVFYEQTVIEKGII